MSTTAVEFDPFSDEFFNDPSDVYRRLRDEAPVYHSERYGFYALSRFADVVDRPPRLAGVLERARHRPLDAVEGSRGDPELPQHHHDGPARARPAASVGQPGVHARGR